MSQFQKKDFLTATILLYGSQEFNSEVLSVSLFWERLRGLCVGQSARFLHVGVTLGAGKTLPELDSQNPPSLCQGRIMQR